MSRFAGICPTLPFGALTVTMPPPAACCPACTYGLIVFPGPVAFDVDPGVFVTVRVPGWIWLWEAPGPLTTGFVKGEGVGWAGAFPLS